MIQETISRLQKLAKEEQQNSGFNVFEDLNVWNTHNADEGLWTPKANPDPRKMMKQYPKGTLGHAYGVYFTETYAGFDPDFYIKETVKDSDPPEEKLAEILYNRTRQTHDLWHIVLGLNSEFEGEQGIQAFGLVQLNSAPSLVLVTADLLKTVRQNTPRTPYDICRRLYWMGVGIDIAKDAKSFVTAPWESYYGKQLSDIRKELNVPNLDTEDYAAKENCQAQKEWAIKHGAEFK